MTTDLDRMEAAARATMPKTPWVSDSWVPSDEWEDFTAAANPTAVLALIAELRDERARNAALVARLKLAEFAIKSLEAERDSLVAHAERLREVAGPVISVLEMADYDSDATKCLVAVGYLRRLAAAMKVESP